MKKPALTGDALRKSALAYYMRLYGPRPLYVPAPRHISHGIAAAMKTIEHAMRGASQ